jgi:SulP family sulfate permease
LHAPSRPPLQRRLRHVLRSPSLLTRETLAGVLTALALIPEVISFSVIAGVDPKVSLIASVVLCLAMSVLGGSPAMVTAAAGSVALVIGPMVHQHGVATFCPLSFWRVLFKFCLVVRHGAPDALYSAIGDDRFVNALGILIFFAQVPHFWSTQPLIVGLFVLTLLIVLWAPRYIKAIPSPLIAIILLTLFTVTTGQLLPTVGDEGSMSGGLPGLPLCGYRSICTR